jgi:hypothetical protein
MGTSHRRKDSRQPKVLRPSGGGSGAPDVGGKAPEKILIPLVKLKLDIVRSAQVGESIRVTGDPSPMLVWTKTGRIGAIPAHLEGIVMSGPYRRGRLDSIHISPPRVVAELHR